MALVGTVRSNEPELPRQLLDIKHRDAFLCVCVHQQQDGCVLCPKERQKCPCQVQESGKRKPQVILDYNACQRAVDHLDQACGTYFCRRQTRRWPMCFFYHLIDISCYNAYVLFTSVNPTWNGAKSFRRRLFLEQVGRALTAPAMANRSRLTRAPSSVSLILQARAQVSD
ncbi:hypothetical protein ABVT39_016988 [Epinephelus coioides]